MKHDIMNMFTCGKHANILYTCKHVHKCIVLYCADSQEGGFCGVSTVTDPFIFVSLAEPTEPERLATAEEVFERFCSEYAEQVKACHDVSLE